MSDLSCVVRGVLSVTSADTGTSKDVTLAAPVKTGSTFVAVAVKDRRCNVLRQVKTLAITDADVSGSKDATALATAVDTTAAQIVTQIREKRTDNYHGATVDFFSATVLRATFNPPAAGDLIDLNIQVIEHKPRRGVNFRLVDANTLRAEWDQQLVAGETIDIAYNLLDMDQIGDMLLETQFRLLRVLAELGDNQIQDLIERDDVGNITSYRVRTFTTKEFAEAATEDIDAGDELEEGEVSRRTVTVDIDIRKNDRRLLISVLTDLLDTPGLTETEE